MKPSPARVHAAMVLAFAEREKRPDSEVRELLARKGYDPDEIDTAMENLPPLGPRPKAPAPLAPAAPAPLVRAPAPVVAPEAPRAPRLKKVGPWLFSAAAGVVLLALVLAFSCGRAAP